MFLSVEITLGATASNDFSKYLKLSKKYVWWNFAIVKPLPLQFTVILLTILKLMILNETLLQFCDSLLVILVSSGFELFILYSHKLFT